MRKVAGEHPFCVLTHMNSYIFHIYFIWFFLLSYLILNFVSLTLSLADTHGIAKYARTYIRRYTHTRTHKEKERKRRCNDNQQTTVTHFGENRRLHLESSKQNYYIISLWVVIKAIFTWLHSCARRRLRANTSHRKKRCSGWYHPRRYRLQRIRMATAGSPNAKSRTCQLLWILTFFFNSRVFIKE